VKGKVDDALRALIEVQVAASKQGKQQPIQVWIDTAFNGGLVIPRPEVERLGLKQGTTTQAILADGNLVDLETYTCYLEWFGSVYRTQVVANDGHTPLLGTMLLADRRLVVDYRQKSVELE